MRMKAAAWIVAALIAGGSLFAADVPKRVLAYVMPPAELYQAHAFVTGQRDETRIPGFERGLADVVRKLTGDHRISNDRVISSMNGDIRDYVTGYTETDRMADIPIHDEQGTRDRPFDLFIEFKHGKIDDLIARLGQEKWIWPRPEILVLLDVTTDQDTYRLLDDADQGVDQRESLEIAAWTMGVPIALPAQEGAAARHAHILEGRIVWKHGMKGWQADWRFNTPGGTATWRIKDVNFDEAFRDAMRRAAGILSGHGAVPDGIS
jgi:uncharacterized protein